MDRGSDPGLAFSPDLSIVGIDHVFHNGGPKPAATFLGAYGPGWEETLAELWRHPTARIGPGKRNCFT